ncbi:MAG TPA: hypothetical protein VJU87_08105 [Gemmatimonadaceae bacterium]|nr:hypothetical protein [Gemmatimonadaceae bacterium]
MSSPIFDFTRLRQLSVAEASSSSRISWDSIAEDAPDAAFPMTRELAAELDPRIAEADADPGAGRSWQEIRAHLLDPAQRRSGSSGR